MMQRRKEVVFWRNPLAALSFLLMIIVAMTGVLVYFLPIADTLELKNKEDYSIFRAAHPEAVPAPKTFDTGVGALSPVDLRLYWVERNLEYGNPAVALDEVKNILVLAPDNREALLLAGKLYQRLNRPAERVDVMRRYYELERSQIGAYELALALKADGHSHEAIDVLLKIRNRAEHSTLFDLLLAELFAIEGNRKESLEYWLQSRAVEDRDLATDYPALYAELVAIGEIKSEGAK